MPGMTGTPEHPVDDLTVAADEPLADESLAEESPLEEAGEAHAEPAPEPTVAVLLYSDDADTRAAVRVAVGRRAAPGGPLVRWTECATSPAVLAEVADHRFDLLILDGEATPTGGMGLCRQLKDEIFECPPVLVLTGRVQDAWLATWSRADLVVPHPLDPVAVASSVAELIGRSDRLAGTSA